MTVQEAFARISQLMDAMAAAESDEDEADLRNEVREICEQQYVAAD